MSQHTISLFQYLEKEQISIDKAEFEFQMQSHPDYPSLLAISDTLSFFNIHNGVMRVEFSDIDLLSDRFVALMKDENSNPQLFIIERIENNYFYSYDKKPIAILKSEIEKRWARIVLLVEKSENREETKPRTNNWLWFLSIVIMLLLVMVLGSLKIDLSTKLFLVLPAVGLLFSVAALKDLFGSKSELLNSFCNMTVSTSCVTVVGSSKWKIFEIVNFSDLSMVFFGSQFLGLLVFLLSGSSASYFNIQQILLISSVPVLFASLYYQKYVEKKWCPICLVIISIILLELAYLFVFQNLAFIISTKALVIFGFVFLSVTLIWSALKKMLIKQKELKEFRFKGTRFMHNYEVFKNSLLANNKTELAFSPIVLGNKESVLEIAMITSPFCGYCKDAHEILERIVIANRDNIKVKIIINADIINLDEEKKAFFRVLMCIYIEKGEDLFLEALHSWFENKNLKNWIKKYTLSYDEEKIDSIYEFQNQWCIANNSYFTPAIYINQYAYPKIYERENIIFFINELLEDSHFIGEPKN